MPEHPGIDDEGGALWHPWLWQITLGAVLLALAIWQVNFHGLGDAFANASYGWLLLAMGVYIISRIVHAYEWRITLTKVGAPPAAGLFGALLIGTLVNSVVPASAGDIVKIQIVANRYRLPRAGLAAGRGAEAVVDAAIMVVFILISFALPGVGFAPADLLWLLAAGTAVLFAAAVAGSRLMPAVMPRWRVLARLPHAVAGGVERYWPRVHDGLEVIRRPRLLAIAILLNLFGWGVDLLILWAYGQTFHLHIPLAAYLSVTVVVAMLTTFPITFGNIGTYEVALLSVLALYAVPADAALAFAAGTHVITTAFNVALGLLAMAAMGIRPGEVFRVRAPGGGVKGDGQA
ncbi:MAG TPA: lysylphosphatidylglycerol synthase transmembrane domain-containing protein [Dehalococcoidia bacterium]|nr:lysylphosphatidylglycerol synthase transmembrane domain-containing protein [Dehalococcoidia bacterium]